ncbi:MAG TPA: hypothetical protein VG821_11965 [Rhizomicrobium sp.]|nr:hypothetical protein [Rhizomicrobium sp.]
MRRVPAVAIIRDAYGFTFSHLGGIIGLIWVPMLLLTVMGFFSFQRYYNDFIEAMAGGNPSMLGSSLLMMMGYLVAALLLEAIMLVGVVQLALGARQAPRIAHFAFGPLEWRMFRAFLALVGLMVLFLLPVFMLSNALLATLSGHASGMGMNLTVLALYAAIALAAPRFFALLPAIAVAETVPVLRRAWALSAGNFWPLLGVLAAVLGPLLLTIAVLAAAVAARAAAAPVTGNAQVQMLATVVQAREALPLMSGLSFLVSPLLVGLVASASVSAWRALSAEPVLDLTA